jgi:hypothetical protein
LVTDRGTTKEFSVNASTEPLELKLFALPEAVPTNFKSTLLLSVTNNSTQNTIYTNIQPFLNVTSLGAVAEFEGPTPQPIPVLEKGNTVIFQWTYRITGDDGDKVRFDASILNGVPGNVVSKEVEVLIIQFAEESGTALETNLSTVDSSPNNIVFFHKETFDALGKNQMWSSSPEDDTGQIFDFNSTNAIFYTNTDANVTVNIPEGLWNSTIRYISSPMPESLTHSGTSSETMTYHFETDLNSPFDTTTNTVMTLGTGLNRPSWNATGHQGAGAYAFSGNDFASIEINDNNDLDDSPATTSAWFNADSSGPSSEQAIYYGESSGSDSYEIFLDENGYLVFRIDAGSVSEIATCTSSIDYRDDSWHHFVAVMPDDNDCELYVDGSLEDTDTHGGNGAIILTGDSYLGARDNIGTDGFNGLIDDLIHWDDYALDESTEGEVTDLFNTNYGMGGHLLNFEIKIVDESGNDLGLANKTITNTTNYPIKYFSDFGEYDLPLNDIWGEFVLSTPSIETRVLEPGERLMMNITDSPKNLGNLNLKMIVDDIDVVSGSGNSFLQFPLPDRSVPGYGSYDNSDIGSISIFNPGPTDNWIKYQSRVVFEDEDSGDPYASFITSSNNQTMGPTQDSPAILEGSTTIFEFDRPRSQPGNVNSDLIPEGRYKMFVFLDGYDSDGKVYFQTTFIGVVRVV